MPFSEIELKICPKCNQPLFAKWNCRTNLTTILCSCATERTLEGNHVLELLRI